MTFFNPGFRKIGRNSPLNNSKSFVQKIQHIPDIYDCFILLDRSLKLNSIGQNNPLSELEIYYNKYNSAEKIVNQYFDHFLNLTKNFSKSEIRLFTTMFIYFVNNCSSPDDQLMENYFFQFVGKSNLMFDTLKKLYKECLITRPKQMYDLDLHDNSDDIIEEDNPEFVPSSQTDYISYLKQLKICHYTQLNNSDVILPNFAPKKRRDLNIENISKKRTISGSYDLEESPLQDDPYTAMVCNSMFVSFDKGSSNIDTMHSNDRSDSSSPINEELLNIEIYWHRFLSGSIYLGTGNHIIRVGTNYYGPTPLVLALASLRNNKMKGIELEKLKRDVDSVRSILLRTKLNVRGDIYSELSHFYRKRFSYGFKFDPLRIKDRGSFKFNIDTIRYLNCVYAIRSGGSIMHIANFLTDESSGKIFDTFCVNILYHMHLLQEYLHDIEEDSQKIYDPVGLLISRLFFVYYFSDEYPYLNSLPVPFQLVIINSILHKEKDGYLSVIGADFKQDLTILNRVFGLYSMQAFNAKIEFIFSMLAYRGKVVFFPLHDRKFSIRFRDDSITVVRVK